MKIVSFSLTAEQIRARSKTVTRRLSNGRRLKHGDIVRAVVKSQGLKRGQAQEPLAILVVTHVWAEALDRITAADVAREGFPGMSPAEFVAMFCRAMRCEPSRAVWRIEFAYVPGGRL